MNYFGSSDLFPVVTISDATHNPTLQAFLFKLFCNVLEMIYDFTARQLRASSDHDTHLCFYAVGMFI
jgi:hypothetical protein